MNCSRDAQQLARGGGLCKMTVRELLLYLVVPIAKRLGIGMFQDMDTIYSRLDSQISWTRYTETDGRVIETNGHNSRTEES